jgi:polar amino acid transport system substrate-binding protein
MAAAALRAGKAVFVEKPLALDEGSLSDVVMAARGGPPLVVGFNRRLAPATRFLVAAMNAVPGSRVVCVRVNAGPVPRDHWIQDPVIGGGRLVGEGCHFIDLATHLAGARACEVGAVGIGASDPDAALGDNVQVTVRCANGSLATVVYTSKGDPKSGKERVEVYAAGVSAIIDDFRQAEVWRGVRSRWRGGQDKGHVALMEAFLRCVRGEGPLPIPLQDLENTSLATLVARRALGTGRVLPVTYDDGTHVAGASLSPP